jgi:hypothetical protein
MTSKIALEVAANYSKLDLPVGVLVIDYKNQVGAVVASCPFGQGQRVHHYHPAR